MKSMNPYHQGQLDFYCAIYAFINSMRALFGIQLNQGRDILATALEEISAYPRLWEALLRNRTDHHWVAPYLLGRFCRQGSLALKVGRLPEYPPNKTALKDPQEWLELLDPQETGLDEAACGDLYSPRMNFLADGQPPMPPNEVAWHTEQLWYALQSWLPSRGFLGMFGSMQKRKRCLMLRFHRFLPGYSAPLVSHWTTGVEFQKDVLELFDCTANKQATHSLGLHEVALHPEQLSQQRYLALELDSVYFLEKI